MESHKGAEVIGLVKKTRESSRCKHYDKMPIPELPNCASYRSIKNQLSIINALFDSYYRTWKEGNRIVGWRNNEATKYVRYILNRIGHLRDQG